MEAVRRLVGVDADQPRLGAVDRTDERRRGRRRRAPAGNVSCSGPIPVLPERSAATDEVLPRAALRLVQPERRRARERRPLQARRRSRARRGRARPRASSTRSTRGCAREYRVVSRTSRFENEVQNGCAVGSSRQAPSSKPSVATYRSANARWRVRVEVAVQERRVDRWGASRRARSEQAGAWRTPRAPRSSSCPARSRRAARCRGSRRRLEAARRSGASSRFSRRYGRKAAKSESRRASTQAGWPRAAARVSSSASSDGTRRAFSQSRRVTRIRLASSESYVERLHRTAEGRRAGGRSRRRVKRSCADAGERRELVGPGFGTRRWHRHALIPAEHAGSSPEIRDLGQAHAEGLQVCRRTHRPESLPFRGRIAATRLPAPEGSNQ